MLRNSVSLCSVVGLLFADPYHADTYGPSCIQASDTSQGDFDGTVMWNAKPPLSEDCLYLNIWVPKSPPKAESNATDREGKLSVMVTQLN